MRILLLLTSYFIFTLCTFGERASKAEEIEIRGLIEDLVYEEIAAAETNFELTLEDAQRIIDLKNQRKAQFAKCHNAFKELSKYKEKGLPFLIEHLQDKRQSINFRNHYFGNSVGDACYWSIRSQLEDRPANYSRYGLKRKGKDGKDHTKPYWAGNAFGEAGLEKWLQANQKLSYAEKQIKCLTWLLDAEKKIGAEHAGSYFLNILPLEIRILERRLENGEKVEDELTRLRSVLETEDVKSVPKDLLPE